jgi:type I restriction enzyme M protein
MNLAIRGIEGNLGKEHADSFHRDLHPDLRADFVLANGSMSSNQSGEGEIRRAIVEADLVDCMVALPGQLFYSTQIPVCLWFIARDKRNSPRSTGAGHGVADRRGEVLFVDARKLGEMVDWVHRELTDADIRRIAGTYHAWRGDRGGAAPYADVPGFCKAATLEEIRRHGHILTPGRYVGAAEVEDDGEPFEEKMQRLVVQLLHQQGEASRLDDAIVANLKELGFGD